jgi:hypothetical protein
MRHTIHFFLFYVTLIVSAHAAAVVEIAVADHQRAQDAWAIATSVLMTGAQGDIVTLVDAGSGQRKATLKVSEEMAASPNQNARSVWLTKQQAAEFSNAKTFLLNTSPTTTSGSSNFLRWVRSLELRRMEFQKATRFDAIYLGSPLVTQPEAYSMVNRYPSDAFLANADSLFAVDKSKTLPLKGITVHVVHSVGLQEFSERNRDFHREKIKRFYGLFIDGLGGNLATFAGNIDHLKSISGATFPRVDYGAPNRAEKPVIYEVITPQLEAMDDARQNSLWANKIGANPPPPKETFSPVDIGITWNRNIDLDLYVKPEGDQELSFKQTASTKHGGRFLRDITSLPGTNGFETITYDSAVPLRTMQVHVNHYAGSAVAPIEIELRVRTNGQTYFRKFSLPPGTGTRGGGAREGTSWMKIPIQQVLGLS